MTWLLNPKAWAAVLVAIALGLAGAFIYRAGKATVRNEFDAYKLDQAEQRVLADRVREQFRAARQAATDKEAEDGTRRFAALETERDLALGAAGELRKATAAAVERARRAACAAGPRQDQPDSDPIGLLGRLYSESDERAGALADYADRLHIAGTVCERTYDAVAGTAVAP